MSQSHSSRLQGDPQLSGVSQLPAGAAGLLCLAGRSRTRQWEEDNSPFGGQGGRVFLRGGVRGSV